MNNISKYAYVSQNLYTRIEHSKKNLYTRIIVQYRLCKKIDTTRCKKINLI